MQFYEINGLCDLGPVSAWILKEIFGGMRYCNFSLLYPTQPQLFSSYSPSWSDVLGTLMTKLEMILNIHCFFCYLQHESRPFSSYIFFLS